MLFFVILNLIGIRWLARANNGITTWKVVIPVLTIIVLLVTHFHTRQLQPPAAASSSRALRSRAS